MTDINTLTNEILKDNKTFNERGGELVTGNMFDDKLMTPEEEAEATRPNKKPRKPRKKKVIPDHSKQIDIFENTTIHKNFLPFLESLKNENNSMLIERINQGFDIIFGKEQD